MLKNIVSDIGGIGLYGVISLLLFFGAFVAMLAVVAFMKRSHAERMGRLPLDSDTVYSTQKGDVHE